MLSLLTPLETQNPEPMCSKKLVFPFLLVLGACVLFLVALFWLEYRECYSEVRES